MSKKRRINRLTILMSRDDDDWNEELDQSKNELKLSSARLGQLILDRAELRQFLKALGHTVSNVLTVVRDTLLLHWFRHRARAQERRERRREERQQRRYRHRMRKTIYGTLIRRMTVFSAVFWGIVIFMADSPDTVYSIQSAISEMLPFDHSIYDIDTMLSTLMIVYAIIMFLWPMLTLRKTAGYIDSIFIAADNLLDKDHDLPKLPAKINELDVKMRGIRLSIIQSDQIAKEAEQRKNDLVVYLAHDLKTPLSSVIGYLSLLEELPDLPVEQRAKYTSITLDKAYRLEQLINEFFEITRFNLQSVELQNNHIDLSIMLMQIADEFFPVLEEKGLTVELTVEPRLHMIGDSDKLMRVFDNLLRNAVSYSYENTRITIEAYQTDDTIEISMSNIGDEIPPQSLERLFEKFFRADSSRSSSTGGSGLGLAIAKHIVEMHGGNISAKSSPICTKFMISLPNVRNS